MVDYLSICVIIKNEAPFMREWIEFHKLVGVQRFYIYDNNSDDNILEVLEPYIKSREVIFTPWNYKAGQMTAYQDCYFNHRKKSKYIAFIDADEFLFSTIEDDIKNIICDYESYPALVVSWILFGSSGFITRPSGLVIENYIKRPHTNFPMNNQVKSIVKMEEMINNFKKPHSFFYKNNRSAVDENYLPLVAHSKNNYGTYKERNSSSRIRINHYMLKSRQDFDLKVSRGAACYGYKKRFDNPQLFWRMMDINIIEDREILIFLPKLKSILDG